jgi:membrane-bound hydrogenase subunit mbhJ
MGKGGRWRLTRLIKLSPWLYHLSLGTCNGCVLELIAMMTPRFDVERFGMLFKDSPRHADIVILEGCGTEKAIKRAKRVLEQVPDPKIIVAIGACACSGGIFFAKRPIEADIYVQGCPPKPEAILEGVNKAIKKSIETKRGKSK